jgi:hypothetical protein
MYNLLRKIHLYAGLTILCFLMMYFLTGYIIIHGTWFGKAPPTAATRTETLANLPSPLTPESLAAHIKSTYNLNGRTRIPKEQPDDAIRFSIARPGTTEQFDLPNNSNTLTIKTTRENLAGTLVQMHRIHGYAHGALFNIWVFLNDLASFSCILFALTGVYLWWKSVKQKLWGILALTASTSYTIAILLYLLYAR